MAFGKLKKNEETYQISVERAALRNTPVRQKCYLQRRTSERAKTLKSVRIEFHNGLSSFDGLMRSVSDTGASIEVFDTLHMPDIFVMKSLHPDIEDFTYTCQVVWRSKNMVGVKFIQPM